MCEHGGCRGVEPIAELIDAVVDLEEDHVAFDSELEDLAPEAVGFDDRVTGLLDKLSDHIDKENLGVFPVAVTILSASGWDIVSDAHAAPVGGML